MIVLFNITLCILLTVTFSLNKELRQKNNIFLPYRLKIFTHKKDCLTRWIGLLMTCMVSSRPKYGTRPVLNFFRCSNDFITQKVYFSRLMRVYLDAYWSEWFGHFFRYRPLLPTGWRIVQIVRQRRRKMTALTPITL
jgi:hypothetical protein